MIPNRMPDDAIALLDPVPTPAGFMMLPMAPAQATPMSPLQNLYQHVYEQALASVQRPALRNLFAVMN